MVRLVDSVIWMLILCAVPTCSVGATSVPFGIEINDPSIPRPAPSPRPADPIFENQGGGGGGAASAGPPSSIGPESSRQEDPQLPSIDQPTVLTQESRDLENRSSETEIETLSPSLSPETEKDFFSDKKVFDLQATPSRSPSLQVVQEALIAPAVLSLPTNNPFLATVPFFANVMDSVETSPAADPVLKNKGILERLLPQKFFEISQMPLRLVVYSMEVFKEYFREMRSLLAWIFS